MIREKVVFTRDPARASFFFFKDTLRIPFLRPFIINNSSRRFLGKNSRKTAEPRGHRGGTDPLCTGITLLRVIQLLHSALPNCWAEPQAPKSYQAIGMPTAVLVERLHGIEYAVIA